MKRLLKYLLWTLLTLFVATIIWVVGLFAGLPLIPFVETDYYVNESNQTLANGLILKQTDSSVIKLEVPNYFSENDQCFDTWVSSTKGQHFLTIKDFSLQAFNADQSEIKKENTYLFWDNGSKDETFKIENYQISKSATTENDKYVFIRTVFDTEGLDNFILSVKLNFTLDNKTDLVEQKVNVNKKHRLTWNPLRAH